MHAKKYFMGGPSPMDPTMEEPYEPMMTSPEAYPEPSPEPVPDPSGKSAPTQKSSRNPYLSKIFGEISESQYRKMKDTATYIWKFLTKKGLNKFQVAGILGNMMQESSLDPNQVTGSYHGIVQIHKDVVPLVKAIYGWGLDGQLNYVADYALGNLNTSSKKDKSGKPYSSNLGYQSGKYVSAAHNNASDSASYFGSYFERAIIKDKKTGKILKHPDGRIKVQEEANRRNYADLFYKAFASGQFKIGGKLKLILK